MTVKCLAYFISRKKRVPFSMIIINVELMHECCPTHLRMATSRMKLDEEAKKRRVNMGKSTKRSDGVTVARAYLPNLVTTSLSSG